MTTSYVKNPVSIKKNTPKRMSMWVIGITKLRELAYCTPVIIELVRYKGKETSGSARSGSVRSQTAPKITAKIAEVIMV